jgi:positive regulator of sigma E activity
MLLKVKAALLTFMWITLGILLVVLIVYTIKTYGLHLLFALSLAFMGAILGCVIYASYTTILDKLQKAQRGQ